MTDPVDARLLGLVADLGRAAVHDIAARLGMDPREVASRLVALSATGLPLLVGVECDPNRLRAALVARPPNAYAVHQGGGYPPPAPYPGPPIPGGYPPGPPSGPHPVHGGPSGPYPPPPPSNPFPVQTGPPSNPIPVAVPQPMSTWGPPQTSSWARGDQPPQDLTVPTVRGDATTAINARTGKVGATLLTQGLEGERLAIQLVELVDPADYLFTAAGYRLQEGERSVVVHTELTNRGSVPFQTLPDLYLVLVTPDGKTISKAPVALSSRPAHRIGVAPGETAGGHTVYVVPDSIVISSVRWSPRPDEESRALTWNVED